jgi:hypothetical protein
MTAVIGGRAAGSSSRAPGLAGGDRHVLAGARAMGTGLPQRLRLRLAFFEMGGSSPPNPLAGNGRLKRKARRVPGDPTGLVGPASTAYFCCRLKFTVTVRMNPVGSPLRSSGW